MADSKRILAIESSGRHASVAALYGNAGSTSLLRQTLLGGNQRTAQMLAPAMQQLLAAVEWKPNSVELVAVTVGPGSFTGLRIGVTTAKAFAYAASVDVIGVNTLESLAIQAPVATSPLWVILDAQRQELFAARFVVGDDAQIQTEVSTRIIPQDEWLRSLLPGQRVIGPALQRLQSRLPTHIEPCPESLWQPTAAAVGRLAWKNYQAGQRDDVWKLSPHYYRPSAAEEKYVSHS